jgi:ABC-type Mn2+/Zn2+ transport system permease subunit
MDKLLEIVNPHFILHHAFYGSLIVGLACPLVGVYFLLRRMVLWGVALPQVSAAGIAFALMLQGFGITAFAGGESGERHLAILGALVFTTAVILALAWLDRRGQGFSEGRIASVYAAAWAASILFVAWNATGETEMMSLLRGELVSISEEDFHAMLDIFLGIAACMLLFRREFLLVSFDRDLAVTLGRSVLGWDVLLYLLVGLTISLGVMTVGPLVVFGFLVLPPLAALPWAWGIVSHSLIASAIGLTSAFLGFYASFAYDLPLGPVVVCATFVLLLLSYGLRALAGSARGPS